MPAFTSACVANSITPTAVSDALFAAIVKAFAVPDEVSVIVIPFPCVSAILVTVASPEIGML